MKFIEKKKVAYNALDLMDISEEMNIPEGLLSVLMGKGYQTPESITNYIKPSVNDMHDPMLFNDMPKIVSRIQVALANKELIAIYGDYDVDGIMATTIMVKGLMKYTDKVIYRVPNRHQDGYGLHKHILDEFKALGVSLVITVDCGITSKEEVAYASTLGMDVIITDHHEAPEVLPECVGIMNAKVSGENYPFKELCGAGNAFKLIWALFGKNDALMLCAFAGIATVADLVPLHGENRLLVKLSLLFMTKLDRNEIKNNGYNYNGLKALKDLTAPGNLSAYHYGFRIGPVLNASGRMADANKAIDMLLNDNYDYAKDITASLIALNTLRREEETRITEEAVQQVINTTPRIIIAKGEDWNSGVVGIAASRLQNYYYCPTIVLTKKGDGMYTGSCRSIDGINIYDALKTCDDLLERWGGHEMAAGLTIQARNIPEFEERLEEYMVSVDSGLFEKTIYYDQELSVRYLDDAFIQSLTLFEPTGLGNPSPKFILKEVEIKNVKSFVTENGLEYWRAEVWQDGYGAPAVCFDCPTPTATIITALADPKLNPKGKEFYKNKKFFNGGITLTLNNVFEHNPIRDWSEDVIYETPEEQTPLEVLSLQDNKLAQLKTRNLETLHDLLKFVPRRYNDYRKAITFREAVEGEECAIVGRVVRVRGDKRVVADCIDLKGDTFQCTWFNQKFILKRLKPEFVYVFSGKWVKGYSGRLELFPTAFEFDIKKILKINPIYPKIKGMSADFLGKTIESTMHLVRNTDYLSKDILDRFNLVNTKQAYKMIHKPNNFIDVNEARKRFIFDQLFKFNFKMKYMHSKVFKQNGKDIDLAKANQAIHDVMAILPYELTKDQKKTIKGMLDGMFDWAPLNALVQGDVGSGKTIVAFIMMYIAVKSGYQAAMVAPTVVLAEQHYEDFKKFGEQLGVSVEFVYSGLKAKERRRIVAGVNDGSIQMTVSTHSIFNEDFKFDNLGVIVLDEQHRFGVAASEVLDKFNPHNIKMSATPIPRTLSMSMYGDNIKSFQIKEKPAGRKDIVTTMNNNDTEVNEFMRKQIEMGHQCYVICPAVEKGEEDAKIKLTSVEEQVELLQTYFADSPNIKIRGISGKIKQAELKAAIDEFSRNEVNILVSTTVVEVGVNVPNATVVVLKDADRFGLAQAHQIRGRVGRGNAQSYCILQTSNPDDPKSHVLMNTNDGFKIAKADLKLRGTGDFIGKSQSGKNDDVILMIENEELYQAISVLTDEIYQDKRTFLKYKYILDEIEDIES